MIYKVIGEFVGAAFIAVGLAMTLTGADPVVPDNAREIDSRIISCPGGTAYLALLDTDDNGDADIILVGEFNVAQGTKGRPAAAVFFSPGADGTFQRAVLIPSGEVFTDRDKFTRRFPHPCDVVFEQKA